MNRKFQRSLLASIPVPPRRGDLGKKVFLQRFLRELLGKIQVLKVAEAKIKKTDPSDFSYLMKFFSISPHILSQGSENISTSLKNNILWLIKEFLGSNPEKDDYYVTWNLLSKNISEYRFPLDRNPMLETNVEDTINKLSKILSSGALESKNQEYFGSYMDYQEGLHPETLKGLWDLMHSRDQIKNLFEVYGKRFQSETAARFDKPLQTEKREKLFHASINAGKLYREGFLAQIPEQSGIGGSQSAGGRKKGTSFTYDFYVAKEIARTLKELALIAQQKIDARQIIDWARRCNCLQATWDSFVRLDGSLISPFQHFGFIEKGRLLFKFKGRYYDVREVFDTPLKVAALYKRYLQENQDRRYDPFVMGLSTLINKLRHINLKDIGVVVATVDMTNPSIVHLGGERELRVPPEAILSVDRLIS